MTSAVFPILTFTSANRCTTERVWSGQFWALSRRKISSRFTPRPKLSKGSLARRSWFSSTDFNDLTDTWTWTIHGRKCCSLSRFVAPDNEDKCEMIRRLFRFRRPDFWLAEKPADFPIRCLFRAPERALTESRSEIRLQGQHCTRWSRFENAYSDIEK